MCTIQALRNGGAPNADDIEHMRRVVSFIKRLLTQALRAHELDALQPGDADSPWR